jgi:hypothetical protein
MAGIMPGEFRNQIGRGKETAFPGHIGICIDFGIHICLLFALGGGVAQARK